MVIKKNLLSILNLKSSVKIGLVIIIDVIEKMNLKDSVTKKYVFYELNKDLLKVLGGFPDTCQIKLNEGSIPSVNSKKIFIYNKK